MNTIPPTNRGTSRAPKAWHRPTKFKIVNHSFKSGPGGQFNEDEITKTKTSYPFMVQLESPFNTAAYKAFAPNHTLVTGYSNGPFLIQASTQYPNHFAAAS